METHIIDDEVVGVSTGPDRQAAVSGQVDLMRDSVGTPNTPPAFIQG